MTIALADLVFRFPEHPQMAVRKLNDLTTHVEAAALDSAVVHIAGVETITGAKTFSAMVTASSGVGLGSLADAILLRDAANAVAQRNGTNPQEMRFYNTYTDAANYERGIIRWDANVFKFGTDTAAGTGVNRGIAFTINGNTKWQITTNQHFGPGQDNALDVGTAALRPRRVYVGTELVVFGTGITAVTGTGSMVLSASPTFTGTIAAAAAAFSGNVSITNATNPTLTISPPNGVTFSNVRMHGNNASSALGLDILVGNANAYLSADTFNFRNAAQSSTYATINSTGLDVLGLLRCDSFRIDVAPTAAVVAQSHHVPISINGVTYKLLLAS